jgi:hypothetical protein
MVFFAEEERPELPELPVLSELRPGELVAVALEVPDGYVVIVDTTGVPLTAVVRVTTTGVLVVDWSEVVDELEELSEVVVVEGGCVLVS